MRNTNGTLIVPPNVLDGDGDPDVPLGDEQS